MMNYEKINMPTAIHHKPKTEKSYFCALYEKNDTPF